MSKKNKLSCAEKQRQYRMRRKQNSEKEEENKLKDRNRYHSKKRLVKDLTPREHRMKKKKWRKSSKKYYDKKQQPPPGIPLSPPNSDFDSINDSPVPGPSGLGNIKRGRKVVLKNKSKINRENKKLGKENSELKRKLEKYKKRLQRYKKKDNDKLKMIPDCELTPKSKTRKQLMKSPNTLKNLLPKELLFQNTLIASLKTKYLAARKNSAKKQLNDIFLSNIMQKYRMQNAINSKIGLTLRRCGNKKIKSPLKNSSRLVKNKAVKYFTRDDVSTMTTGKKETLTKNKEKKQKRYLVESMKNMYKTFITEEAHSSPMSYTSFTRCRPFYVIKPNAQNRDTCACKLHSNLYFKIKKLYMMKRLGARNAHELVQQIVCNEKNINCMYNKCLKCKINKVPIKVCHEEIQKLKTVVSWFQWDIVVEQREKIRNGKTVKFSVKITKKQSKFGTLQKLQDLFQNEIHTFKTHSFNITNQIEAYRVCQENLTAEEAIVHVDFSENYACKLSEEIQSYHFGASRNQCTLHTGILYLHGAKKGISFCTISSSLEHSPAAIWAHLEPIIRMIKDEAPTVQILHFFSDGPFTQYRQKKNFYLFSTIPVKEGFTNCTWSFFEAGHGKGAADGIGASLKRSADNLVAYGNDMSTAEEVYNALKGDTTIKLFYVSPQKIVTIENEIPNDLIAICGTKQVHQLVTLEPGRIMYREAACYCKDNIWERNQYCSCTFAFRPAKLIPQNSLTTKKETLL